MVCLAAASGCDDRYRAVAALNRTRGDPYLLDAITRDVPLGGAVKCPEVVETMEYRGDIVRYATPVRIATAFAARLRRFERIVADVGQEFYGRAPDRILHFGARSCRTIRGRKDRLSEHALGNALDVSGFRFAGRRTASRERSALSAGFTVNVRKHWVRGSGANAKLHAKFLREVVDRLRAERVFRGVLGPGHEGHADHFHFDQAPWRYVRL